MEISDEFKALIAPFSAKFQSMLEAQAAIAWEQASVSVLKHIAGLTAPAPPAQPKPDDSLDYSYPSAANALDGEFMVASTCCSLDDLNISLKFLIANGFCEQSDPAQDDPALDEILLMPEARSLFVRLEVCVSNYGRTRYVMMVPRSSDINNIIAPRNWCGAPFPLDAEMCELLACTAENCNCYYYGDDDKEGPEEMIEVFRRHYHARVARARDTVGAASAHAAERAMLDKLRVALAAERVQLDEETAAQARAQACDRAALDADRAALDARAELERAREQRNDVNEKLTDARPKLERARAELDAWAQRNDVNEKLTAAGADFARVKVELAHTSEALDRAKVELAHTSEALARVKVELAHTSEALDRANEGLKMAHAENGRVVQRLALSLASETATEGKLERAAQQIKTLTATQARRKAGLKKINDELRARALARANAADELHALARADELRARALARANAADELRADAADAKACVESDDLDAPSTPRDQPIVRMIPDAPVKAHRFFDRVVASVPFALDGGKPAGGKPAGGKPAGGKPAGGKPAGGKPAGASALARSAADGYSIDLGNGMSLVECTGGDDTSEASDNADGWMTVTGDSR